MIDQFLLQDTAEIDQFLLQRGNFQLLIFLVLKIEPSGGVHFKRCLIISNDTLEILKTKFTETITTVIQRG